LPPAPSVRRAVAGKARVHELAKELGVTSKDVLKKLADLGEYVKSASSTVEAPVARKLRDSFPSDGGKQSHANGASTSGRASSSAPAGGISPTGGGIAAKPGPAPLRECHQELFRGQPRQRPPSARHQWSTGYLQSPRSSTSPRPHRTGRRHPCARRQNIRWLPNVLRPISVRVCDPMTQEPLAPGCRSRVRGRRG